MYDDQSIKNVLDAFGSLVTSLPEDQRKTIKAVGGVGQKRDRDRAKKELRQRKTKAAKGFTIKHYWKNYDNTKSPKSFRAAKLIHIVKKCSEHQQGNVSENYELLLQGVLDLLRKANMRAKNREGRSVYFSQTLLIQNLRANNNVDNFRKLLTEWIIHDFPCPDCWGRQMEKLKALLGLHGQSNDDTQDFIAYDDEHPIQHKCEVSATNIYECANGQKIEVSTIHAVKAETHDATLILETKYYENDISHMLDFFISDAPDLPSGNARKAGFMRKLYVAASRPRHFLCLALHKNNISQEQITALKAKRWNIECIT